jgi:hypothetical protein
MGKIIITVKVKPNSPKSEFLGSEKPVLLKAQADKNKANIELLKLVAKHYKVSSSQVKIIRGLTSKEKVIEINS